MKMTYLDMVLNESMRVYPGIVGFVTRRAARDYEVNGLKIPQGMSVMVPVSYLHLDPEVWHEPHRFDPERFSPDNITMIDKASFQPFGQGPRQCIGRNFALLQARLMMCKFISTFRVSVDVEHHKEAIKMQSAFIAATVPNGVWLKFENLNI
ncbi:cytochrome P450 3A19-like [Haemaphysalis longicornis]